MFQDNEVIPAFFRRYAHGTRCFATLATRSSNDLENVDHNSLVEWSVVKLLVVKLHLVESMKSPNCMFTTDPFVWTLSSCLALATMFNFKFIVEFTIRVLHFF